MNKKVVRTFKTIAKHDGISVKEVRDEIQSAIDAGFLSSEPYMQAKCRKIPCRAARPTPEEVVVYLVKQIKRS